MKVTILAMFLAIFISGCGKSADPREELAKRQKIPGYREARIFCTQCHKMPDAAQHEPAAWPGVVTRMEGLMQTNRRKVPTAQEREAIIGYLQSNPS